jgi:hypothetical protein
MEVNLNNFYSVHLRVFLLIAKGMFVLAATENVTYMLNPLYLAWNLEDSVNRLKLFGEILGKALFERIPIGACLDRTLIKHLLNQKITLEDIFHFDKEVKKSNKFISGFFF